MLARALAAFFLASAAAAQCGDLQTDPIVRLLFPPLDQVALDFDGDGQDEMFVSYSTYFSVFRWTGSSGWTEIVDQFVGVGFLFSPAAADFDGDGREDLVSVLSADRLQIRFSTEFGLYPTDAFGGPIVPDDPGVVRHLTTGFVDADPHADVAVTIAGPTGFDQVIVYRGDGAGGLTLHRTLVLPPAPTSSSFDPEVSPSRA